MATFGYWKTSVSGESILTRLGVKKEKNLSSTNILRYGLEKESNQGRTPRGYSWEVSFTFLKKIIVKKFHPPEILEKCKSRLQWGITSHWSEWPLLKSLQTIKFGEAVEKREPSYTDAGNVSWEQPPWSMRWMFLKQRKREWNYDNSLTPYKKPRNQLNI